MGSGFEEIVMLLVKPSYEILAVTPSPLKLLELAGRTCYKSEDRITDDSAEPFVRRIVNEYRHESVIEHASLTVKFIVDRGVTHELVRHRLVSYSQESTRYCNYAKKGVCFIIPPWVAFEPGEYNSKKVLMLLTAEGTAEEDRAWLAAMSSADAGYLRLLQLSWSPQQARSVLPNSLKTEIVATANFREWRHILKLRTSAKAHPQMREVMVPLLCDLANRFPVIFGDIPCER